MELSLLELNELIYCVGTATKTGSMVNKKVANKLWAKLSDELDRRCAELDKQTSDGPFQWPILRQDHVKVSKGWSNQWPPMPTGH